MDQSMAQPLPPKRLSNPSPLQSMNAPLPLGTYPTPLEPLSALSSTATELWVKRDDLTNPHYGGNKVRKLAYLLKKAQQHKRAQIPFNRLLTFGAAGSHHVLATTIHGRANGFDVAAVLTPQPSNPHAIENLQHAMDRGLIAYPCPRTFLAPVTFARVRQPGDYVIAPGGSSITGALGYVDAALELEEQVKHGAPMPEVIVVAFGSGATAAGLLAGLMETQLTTVIHAVRVVPAAWGNHASVVALAAAAARQRNTNASLKRLSSRIRIVTDRLGKGYGYSTPWGELATNKAQSVGICVEQTYTAKAFSHALRLVQTGQFQRVLYWHTLSHPIPSLPLPTLPEPLAGLFVA